MDSDDIHHPSFQDGIQQKGFLHFSENISMTQKVGGIMVFRHNPLNLCLASLKDLYLSWKVFIQEHPLI